MLNGVHVINFGNHRDTRMSFGPFNALVGQNGAGKSTIFRAILAYRDAQTPKERQTGELDFKAALEWPTWYVRSGETGGRVAIGQHSHLKGGLQVFGGILDGRINELICECSPDFRWLTGEKESQKLTWIPRADFIASLSEDMKEAMFAAVKKNIEQTNPETPVEMPKYRVESQKKLPQELSDAAKRIHYFKAEGGVISEPSYTTEVPPRMSEHGLHLASVVANMIGSEPERFEEMLDAFRSVIPSIKRILTRRREITIKEQRMIVVNRKEVPFEEERTVAGDELIFDTVAGRLPMQAMSEGTMMALAILTQVYAQDGSAVLLLDDIEQGLHAKAQHELISQLRKIQKRRTDLQIILSTHSPFIIDEMTADEIWLLHSTNETGAKARKLSEHPDSERALKVLSTGEFWSAEGEEWVVEPTAK